MREPFRRYSVEEPYDNDVHCVDLKYWNKQREALQLVHTKDNLIDLWSKYE